MPKSVIDLVRPQLVQLFAERWNILDWGLYYPWWRRPAKCRILMYGDGSVFLSGGGFQGLTYVKTLLETRAYAYVDFDVTFVNRNGSDPSATLGFGSTKLLTDLDIMNNYDQVWLFGYNGGNSLTAGEVTLMDNFMAAPKYGGVLTTGDHASLGQGISGAIKRVGQMRLYPAPPSSPPGWNTTLERRPVAAGEPLDPPSPGQPLNFNDQSDDIAQTIRWRRYPTISPFRSRPHPVLCGPQGPIDVLPDHEHEGEALAPPIAGDVRWPTVAGHQEPPEVIAWGLIKDPAATNHGHEFGVVSAYNGHQVEVGRIVADSTWHHWFDINITGLAGSGWPYTGFDATVAGNAELKKIDAYYLNVGVWLSPPGVQQAMRDWGWWSIIWSNQIIELDLKAPIRWWGAMGLDALGRWVSRCTAFEFVWPREPIYKPKIPWFEWIQLIRELDLVDLPVDHYIAGGIVRELATQFGHLSEKRSIADKPPSEKELRQAIEKGTEHGLAAMKADLSRQQKLVGRLVDQDFDPRGLVGEGHTTAT